MPSDRINATLVERPPPVAVDPQNPWYMLFVAFLLMIWSDVAVALASIPLIMVLAAQNGLAQRYGWTAWSIGPVPATLLTVAASELVLLRSAWHRAMVVSPQDRRAGLGLGPVRRSGLLVALIASLIVLPRLWIWAVDHWLRVTANVIPTSSAPVQPSNLWGGFAFVTVVVIAPICEELLFHGWVWVGLRRRWGTPAVALATATLFLMAHIGEGFRKPIYLVPSVCIYTLARVFCGGTRATILLHGWGNFVATVLVPIASTIPSLMWLWE